ncbi:MAG: GNAT family N-acetyltransferase [Pseudonocardiaceae bacterium]
MMIVRRESPEDRAAISSVHTAAFGTNGQDVAEARLVDDLRDEGDVIPGLSLVATVAGEVVGHVVCSRGRVAGRSLPGLGPLGVLPAHQNRGVGSALMHAVLAVVDALDEPAVVLLGEPSYYRRFGFVLAEPVGLLPPDPHWVPHFQVRPLHAWDDSLRGTFRYAPAFERL